MKFIVALVKDINGKDTFQVVDNVTHETRETATTALAAVKKKILKAYPKAEYAIFTIIRR